MRPTNKRAVIREDETCEVGADNYKEDTEEEDSRQQMDNADNRGRRVRAMIFE